MDLCDPMVRGKGDDDRPSPTSPSSPPSRRGIGGAFADSAVPLHPPPPIANFFHHNNNNNNDGGDHGKNNGGINVDNIFASMTEDDEDGPPDGNNANNGNIVVGSTIFRNFASMSNENGPTLARRDDHHDHLRQRAIASPFSSVAPGIPIRKYSDYTNYYSSSRDGSVIPATSTTTTTAAQVNDYYVGSNVKHGDGDDGGGRMSFCRSESNDVLSKSMGTTSLRLASRVMTEGEPDPTPTIRHAGYLLKRSNVPYVPYVVPEDEYPWGGIAPLPDLSDLSREKEYGYAHFNGSLSLPGGVESSGVSNMLSPERVFENPDSSMAKVDSTSVTGISSGECITSIDEETTCFCSPIAKYFKQMFLDKRPTDALVAGKGTNCDEYHESMSGHGRDRSKSQLPIIPRGMTLPVSPAINQYKMPLKLPARSDPVPISPAGDHRATIIPRPRSFTITSPFVATGGGTNTQPRREYPPPPPDYIDPKDGHIWRSKYCILEEGILYFYRTAEEGESDEARTERYEHRLYSEELEDIVLGEELVISSSRRSLTGQKRWSMLSTEDRKSSHDIYDLSKSPMPQQRKSDLFGLHSSPFHRQGSSVLIGPSDGAADDDEGSFRRAMHHTNSVGTFNNDADILWEKRVALDCVGAVRSSEQEHGIHAFELLAYGCGGPDDDTASTFRGGGAKDEIIDRLILRASSSDDRNAWMFQFHRSLTSFVMQRFVIKSAAAVRGNRLGGMRPDSPNNRGGRLRLPNGGAAGKGGVGSPFVAKSSFMTSPSGNNSFGGTSFSAHVVGSLSHGHGRNALYRRKVRDGKNVYGDASVASVVSPLHTPAGTPRGGSSPVESMPSMIMIQSDSARLQNKVELPSLKGLREGGKKKDGRMSPATTSASAAPQKYVPPHMRKKLASSSGGDEASSTTKKLKEKQLPSTDDATKQTEMGNASPTTPVVSSGSLGGSLSDSPLSASSLLSGQMDDSEDFAASIRLGGCADPKVVVGSIIDHHYIDRKASVVGNARLEAYGGTGGGYFRRIRHCRAEDESTPLDDVGVNMLESKTVALKWEVGASSECGVRNSNEDSFVVINNLDNLMKSQGLVSFSQQDLGQTKQQGMYAIFDGHVGNQAARFSAEKFPDILMEEQSVLASRDSACLSSIEERADSVLKEAFDRLDREFCCLCTEDGRDWDCGSTALVALIVDDVVSLANLGDCRGVVCRQISEGISDAEMDGWEALDKQDHVEDPLWDRSNGGGNACDSYSDTWIWKEMTSTHSPLFDEERDRIEEANGWIIQETEIPIGQLHRMDIFDKDVIEIVKRCFADRMKQHRSDPVRQIQIARTCGDLAVSRAIGDRDFKAAYNMPPSDDALGRSWEGPLVFIYPEGHSGRFKGDIVSSVPDIQFFKVGREPTILILACDGLWDVMDGDDAVRIVRDLLLDKKLSAKDGAARLTELAKHLGSSDNVTVILIRFYWEE